MDSGIEEQNIATSEGIHPLGVNEIIYKGTPPNEVIFRAIDNKHDVSIRHIGANTHITVESIGAYDVKIIDTYIYDENKSLMKQLIKINGKDKVIFDRDTSRSSGVAKGDIIKNVKVFLRT